MIKKSDNYWMVKVGSKYNPQFIKDRINFIQTERIKNNKDKKMQPPARIFLAAMRDDVTVKRLAEADFIDEKYDTKFNYGRRK